MKRRDFIKTGALTATGLLAGLSCIKETSGSADLEGRRPNIILVMTDDQGYGDLACHGNPVLKTPNLDALHARSLRFTKFQVSPTCSPTRASLLTGRHEFKNGGTHTINERERLALESVTLADMLKKAGANGIWEMKMLINRIRGDSMRFSFMAPEESVRVIRDLVRMLRRTGRTGISIRSSNIMAHL